MSRFNLSKSIWRDDPCIFDDKPRKSFLEVGGNCSVVEQKAAGRYSYSRSSQGKRNGEMVFGDDGVRVGTTAIPYMHNLGTHSDSHDITFRLQEQVAMENQWVRKEHRGNDDTSRGKGLTMVSEFIEQHQSHNGICDTEIRVDKEVFRVHRAILSCYSSYFSNLFSKEVGKRRSPIIIRMSGISSEAFRVFLNYVYDRSFSVDYDNVQDVIKTADALGIPVLKKRCLLFLEHTSLDDAIKILRRSRHSPGSAMFKFLVSRVSENFRQLNNKKEFLELDASTICWILSDDNIKITKEMDVFDLAIKWLNHSKKKREKYLSKVMSCVRFSSMTQDELFECFELSDMLKKSVKVRNTILYSNWVLTAGALKRKDPLQVPLVAPRNCFTEIGQLSTMATSEFFSVQASPDVRVDIDPSPEVVDRRLDQETANSTVLPQLHFHDADALLDGKLYFFGGSVPKLANGVDVPTNVAFVYNNETRKWTQLKSMHTLRCHHATCALGGMLYVIGGEDDKSRVLRSVECYNPKTNAWCFVKSMMNPRLGASAAELDGKIIVAGGYGQSRLATNTTEDPVLPSVESYDPKLNSWGPKNELRLPRCYSSLVSLRGKLYLFGGATSSVGTSELTSVSSIEVYNKNRGIWEEEANLNFARHQAKCFVAGNRKRIYIVGGTSTRSDSSLPAEHYDVIKKVWFSDEVPIPAKL